MINGAVDDLGQASVPLEIRFSDGRFYSLEVVVDTGFNGHLTLYPELIEQLGLRPMRSPGEVFMLPWQVTCAGR